MKTILLLHDESGSPKPRFQNVAGSKVTQRASEGTPGCNCDRWGTRIRTVSNTMSQVATELIDTRLRFGFVTCRD